MKVKLSVEFEVPDTEDENVAKSAASQAVYDYLAFCMAIDTNPGREKCRVHVDGHGDFDVFIGEDHE